MSERRPQEVTLEDYAFIALVVIVTLAFAWLISPYFGPVLWALVAALMFQPLAARLTRKLGGRANIASGLVLAGLLGVFIVPAILLGVSLVQEAGALYAKIQSGQIDFGALFRNFQASLPRSIGQWIGRSGLTDFEAFRREFGSSVASGLQQIAGRLFTVGQGALRFLAELGVMLYLTFFLLRDGQRYGDIVREALPLRPHLRDALIDHFVIVVRATMKGTVVVAVMQGLVGGVIFAALGIEAPLLWGVIMGFFSLLPAVGTGIVWVPVAIYLLATGAIWKGIVMIGSGLFVIGMIDNLLRPILVGRDTRMPDFVVLIATLSGFELFGLNGFIMGPVIAAVFIAIWNLVGENKAKGDATGAELEPAAPSPPSRTRASRTKARS